MVVLAIIHIHSSVTIVLNNSCLLHNEIKVSFSVNGQDYLDTVNVYTSDLIFNASVTGFNAPHYFNFDSIYFRVQDSTGQLIAYHKEQVNLSIYKYLEVSIYDKGQESTIVEVEKCIGAFKGNTIEPF